MKNPSPCTGEPPVQSVALVFTYDETRIEIRKQPVEAVDFYAEVSV